MTHRHPILLLSSLSLVAVGALAGCRAQTSKDTPIFGIRNMFDQDKYDIQEESDFFLDRRTMRPAIEGTVAREKEIDIRVSMGRTEDNQAWVLAIPPEVVGRMGGMPATLKRGQERYGIYCTPCHDGAGYGNGIVKQRAVASGAAAFVPPTYHQDRIRHMPDGQLYATIANGKGNMPSYPQIAVDDRWAIVAYVRALQLSQEKVAPKEAPPAASGAASPGAPPGSAAPASSGAPHASGSAAPHASAAPSGSASTAPGHAGSAAAPPHHTAH